MSTPLQEVRVVLREGANPDQAWLVEINPDASLSELLPDLIKTLDISGETTDFQVTWQGSLRDMQIAITRNSTPNVGAIRPLNTNG